MSSSSAIQTQIVNQSGHVLVITAPQCGAINVLINKARLLMDEAIAPQHILVLTCNEDSSFLQNKLSATKQQSRLMSFHFKNLLTTFIQNIIAM